MSVSDSLHSVPNSRLDSAPRQKKKSVSLQSLPRTDSKLWTTDWTLNWISLPTAYIGIDNFCLCPWIMICKLPGPPRISYNLLKPHRWLFLSGTKNEFGCPADFRPDDDPWIGRNPLILSRTLSLDFVFRPPKDSIHHLSWIQSMNPSLHSPKHHLTYQRLNSRNVIPKEGKNKIRFSHSLY